ncbi:unnamed protein product [Tuber aestivum]|uniref:Uncharacterized protein n=1 Tax=Tuber aestivum TaxID=59557 RepID=A0A292Q5M3_9PEZI|nr:unnamed protein product [Tuber aestivum]
MNGNAPRSNTTQEAFGALPKDQSIGCPPHSPEILQERRGSKKEKKKPRPLPHYQLSTLSKCSEPPGTFIPPIAHAYTRVYAHHRQVQLNLKPGTNSPISITCVLFPSLAG